MKLVLVSAVILLDQDQRILLASRPAGKAYAGYWEFPGGKIEPGETPEAALIRELEEELSIKVAKTCLAPFTFVSHDYGDFHLLMPLFLCRKWVGSVQPKEGQEIKWVRTGAMRDFSILPADLPVVAMLEDFL